jgi:multidrug efflux system membrane fusion protein
MSVSPTAVPTSESEQHRLPAPEPQKALPAPQGSGGLWRKIGLVLILLAAGAFAYYRIRSNKQSTAQEEAKTAAAANRATPVTVAPVASRTMPIYFTALGTVTAYNSVTIKSRVDGQLLSVNVREGQQVHQGQLLAVIDPRPYDAVLAQAVGQLAKDEAAARNNEAEANRYHALYQAGVVSKESEQAQISNSGQSVGTLDADRAAIQAAKVNVAYTRITSPINGVVGLRQVDPGNIVHAADTTGLILVTQLQPIAVIFTLPEDQLPPVLKLMRGGSKLVVEAFDRNQSTHLATGTLLTVDNQIDTTTGTLKGKAVFDNKDGALFPNQFVNVRLVLEERPNSLVVPAAAIQTGANGNFVYVVKPCPASGCPSPDNAGERHGSGTADAAAADSDTETSGAGSAHKRSGPQYYVTVQNVVVDLTEGSNVILKSGVNPGDQVVIDGQEKLKQNSKVTPKQGVGRPASASQGANAGPAQEPTTPAAANAGRTRANAHPGMTGSSDPAAPAGSQTGSRP